MKFTILSALIALSSPVWAADCAEPYTVEIEGFVVESCEPITEDRGEALFEAIVTAKMTGKDQIEMHGFTVTNVQR